MAQGLILTGCAGFIGIHFLFNIDNMLRLKYDRIISIDKLGYASEYNIETYKELCSGLKIENVDCDILDLSHNLLLSKNYEWDVLDFASSSHVDKSIENPFFLYEENCIIPSRLLSSFEDIGSIRSYYHISTDEVYGDLPLDVEEKDWFKITSPYKPSNPYSASKVAQDVYLYSIKRTFKLPVRIIRMANQFGNFQHPEKMLPASCLRAFRGDSIKVYGAGLNMRQWTPVEITTKIIMDKLVSLENFEVLHIANKYGLTNNNNIVNSLVDIIGEYTGNVPHIEYVPDRKGHDLVYALETTKEIDEYFKDVDLNACLASTAEFYYTKRNEFR